MWRKILKCVGKQGCPRADCCLSNGNQGASEIVHGAENLAVQKMTCDIFVEESKVCKGDHCNDDENHAKANSSFAHAVINMIGMVIGLGQLSTPYAVENGGWSSVFLLIGLGVICAFTSHLLGICLDKSPKSRSYVDIGRQAFGRKGRVVTATFIYMEIFMSLVSYTISLHDNLVIVFSRTSLINYNLLLASTKLSSSQILTIIAVFISLPSLWLRDLSFISFLSSGGIFMSLVIFSSVAFTAIFGGVKPSHQIPVLQLRQIPHISGLYVFSYAGHIVFPDLYKAMKDPSKFTKVSIVSFALVTALYTALGLMGAKIFGPEVNSQVTLSMPRHLPFTKIALCATVLTPMTKYALEFAPFAIQFEHNFLPQTLSSRAKLLIRGSVGSFILLIILTLALSIPYFEHVLSLTGSLVSISLCMILPCAFYTKICWSQISKPLLILNVTLIAFGFLLGVFGTLFSLRSLIRNILSKNHPAGPPR